MLGGRNGCRTRLTPEQLLCTGGWLELPGLLAEAQASVPAAHSFTWHSWHCWFKQTDECDLLNEMLAIMQYRQRRLTLKAFHSSFLFYFCFSICFEGEKINQLSNDFSLLTQILCRYSLVSDLSISHASSFQGEKIQKNVRRVLKRWRPKCEISISIFLC